MGLKPNTTVYENFNVCKYCRRRYPKDTLYCPNCHIPLRRGNGAYSGMEIKMKVRISGITGKPVTYVDLME